MAEVKTWIESIMKINCDVQSCHFQIGPTGGDNGYSAITGHVGWGIAWYINGLLIPEIYVVRGKTYTFVVEGGDDKEFPAGYHPFYITDDPEGGYEFKSERERRRSRVFAGVEQTRFGGAVPSATGRLCEWKEDEKQPANFFTSFGAYQRSLSLFCQEGGFDCNGRPRLVKLS